MTNFSDILQISETNSEDENDDDDDEEDEEILLKPISTKDFTIKGTDPETDSEFIKRSFGSLENIWEANVDKTSQTLSKFSILGDICWSNDKNKVDLEKENNIDSILPIIPEENKYPISLMPLPPLINQNKNLYF